MQTRKERTPETTGTPIMHVTKEQLLSFNKKPSKKKSGPKKWKKKQENFFFRNRKLLRNMIRNKFGNRALQEKWQHIQQVEKGEAGKLTTYKELSK